MIVTDPSSIPPIDISQYLPDDDSLLMRQIKRRKLWAVFYLYICGLIQGKVYELDYNNVLKVLKLQHRVTARDLCDQLVSFGYARKVPSRVANRKYFYLLKEEVFQRRFIVEAQKTLDEKK